MLTVSLAYRTSGTKNPRSHSRPGNIKDWPRIARLWFADDINHFAKFDKRIYLFTKSNRVYSFGYQNSSQNVFGLDYSPGRKVYEPTEIFELQNKNIVKLVSSEYHVLALSAYGRVWAWGYNYWGQLGDNSYDDKTKPVRVSYAKNVVDIAVSEHTSFALTEHGDVFAWGVNKKGECGIPGDEYYNLPKHVNLDKVASLHATFAGTGVALTEKAQVYVWGYNTYPYPSVLKLSGKPVSVATTRTRHYILTEEGRIWRSKLWNQLEVTLFYSGTIKLKALYAAPLSYGFLVGESIDGKLWIWNKAESDHFIPMLSSTTNIATLFAEYRPDGHLPFMVKLGDGHTTTTPTTSTTTPPPTTTLPTLANSTSNTSVASTNYGKFCLYLTFNP